MPRPIKETPILFDEDAYRFEIAAHNVIHLPEDEQEEMLTFFRVVLCSTKRSPAADGSPDFLFAEHGDRPGIVLYFCPVGSNLMGPGRFSQQILAGN